MIAKFSCLELFLSFGLKNFSLSVYKDKCTGKNICMWPLYSVCHIHRELLNRQLRSGGRDSVPRWQIQTEQKNTTGNNTWKTFSKLKSKWVLHHMTGISDMQTGDPQRLESSIRTSFSWFLKTFPLQSRSLPLFKLTSGCKLLKSYTNHLTVALVM